MTPDVSCTRKVIIVGDLNVAATQKDVHWKIKHAKCYAAEELALLSALTSRFAGWRRQDAAANLKPHDSRFHWYPQRCGLMLIPAARHACRYTDVWRRLHPDTEDAFTVWDEYTSARLSNEVRQPLHQLHLTGASRMWSRQFTGSAHDRGMRRRCCGGNWTNYPSALL